MEPSLVRPLQVRIISIEDGLEIIDNIKQIRIKSTHFDALIMNGHMPIFGEIDGEIIIITYSKEVVMEDVKGFFCHKDNTFTFMKNY